MDRARAAGFIENNFVQNMLIKKNRMDHYRRIRKIKNRKPGSSVTLDNNPPDIMAALANDPRKKSGKNEVYLVIERENK